jgi:hypothetical protein
VKVLHVIPSVSLARGEPSTSHQRREKSGFATPMEVDRWVRESGRESRRLVRIEYREERPADLFGHCEACWLKTFTGRCYVNSKLTNFGVFG